ncbi:P-loop NTPase family protein [Cellulosilyticum ruminicola]|uniref:hypothetical protein n=1 Tax=Cellulosilyticum ruminicola TaxID=425254 RepID=UPI0006D0C64D|nr:hypothetical protein [Cellulosilyticum ruminicola]
MKLIHILGASGSGTSTLGRVLEERYQYKHLDTDDYYWLLTNPPFTQAREEKERIALLKRDMAKYKKWVIIRLEKQK